MSVKPAIISLIKKFPKGSIWQTRYLCLPFTLIMGTIAISHGSLPVGVSLTYFFLGVTGWTLLEYIMHRWVLHARPKNPVGRAALERLHIFHHNDPTDESQVCIPFVLSFPFWLTIFGLIVLFGGNGMGGMAFTAGLALMMVVYDIAHYSAHYMPATNRLLKHLKRQHLLHHFKDDGKRFGVTSPVWDYVFRTHS